MELSALLALLLIFAIVAAGAHRYMARMETRRAKFWHDEASRWQDDLSKKTTQFIGLVNALRKKGYEPETIQSGPEEGRPCPLERNDCPAAEGNDGQSECRPVAKTVRIQRTGEPTAEQKAEYDRLVKEQQDRPPTFLQRREAWIASLTEEQKRAFWSQPLPYFMSHNDVPPYPED